MWALLLAGVSLRLEGGLISELRGYLGPRQVAVPGWVRVAMLWLGAWCVFHFRGRLGAAISTSLACFVVAVGFRE